MPEGHTIHRLAGSLNGAFRGTFPAVSSPQGRFVEGAAILDGRQFIVVAAAGHMFMPPQRSGDHLVAFALPEN